MGKQLNADLIKKLCKKYTPSSSIDMQFRGADITFKTDDEGNPVLLFAGKRKENGDIKGLRYARVLRYDHDGNLIKDHWDLKGDAS